MVVIVSTISSVGVIIPGTVTVPPGGQSFNFILIPSDTFTGGLIDIKLNSTSIHEDQPCQTRLHVELNPGIEGGPARISTKKDDAAGSSLALIPNPVKDEVQLQFDYGVSTTGNHPSIEIYDLLGRQLENFVPQSLKGNWNLNMDTYQAGQYLVVMKINGNIVQQKNLILTH